MGKGINNTKTSGPANSMGECGKNTHYDKSKGSDKSILTDAAKAVNSTGPKAEKK